MSFVSRYSFAPSRLWAVAVVAVLLGTPGAVIAHDDVVPYLDLLTNRLRTGGYDDPADTYSVAQRVFGYDFGEDELDPWIIRDPGFNNDEPLIITNFPNGGLLPASRNLFFSVFGGPYGSLHYWGGNGSPAFSPVTDGTEIIIDSGTPFLRIGATTTSGSINIVSTGAGRVHDHIDSLIGSGGSGVVFATDGAPHGFYAFGATLSLSGTSPTYGASDPIYFVYNVGMSESLHDEAIDFYNVQVVPEPSSLALAGIGAVGAGLAALRSRQRLSRQKAGKNLA